MSENLFDTENLYQRDVNEILKPITVTTNSPLTITKLINDTIKELNEQLKANIGIDTSKQKITVPLPERYIINENACILFWENGEKTVVKRCADDVFNPRLAFLTAFFQHYINFSKSKANKYLANLKVEEIKDDNYTRHKKDKN